MPFAFDLNWWHSLAKYMGHFGPAWRALSCSQHSSFLHLVSVAAAKVIRRRWADPPSASASGVSGTAVFLYLDSNKQSVLYAHGPAIALPLRFCAACFAQLLDKPDVWVQQAPGLGWLQAQLSKHTVGGCGL